jgi:hypothetical protein
VEVKEPEQASEDLVEVDLLDGLGAGEQEGEGGQGQGAALDVRQEEFVGGRGVQVQQAGVYVLGGDLGDELLQDWDAL